MSEVEVHVFPILYSRVDRKSSKSLNKKKYLEENLTKTFYRVPKKNLKEAIYNRKNFGIKKNGFKINL